MKKSNKRVVIVDDNATNLKLMGYLVTQVTGRTPDSFSCPIEAHKALIKNDYDLLLIDQHMPNITGLELLNKLILEGKLPKVVALVTAVKEPLLQSALRRYGITEVIQKPFDIHKFRNFVQLALSTR